MIEEQSGPSILPTIGHGASQETPQTVLGVMQSIDARVRTGDVELFQPMPTGFAELDVAISGGLRPTQLALLSGPAGVGKTSFALQIARNIAMNGLATCVFVCYEHEADFLAQRLISMESVALGDGTLADGLRLRDIADLVTTYQSRRRGQASFTDAVSSDPRGLRAIQRIQRYGQNLILMKGSSYTTTVEAIAGVVRNLRAYPVPGRPRRVVLFVDYLQKIATPTSHSDESARNIEAIEGLKEMALSEEIAVVAIVTAEVEGLKAQRLRLQHLLASPALAYEADIIMLMNEKYDIVDRRHVEYNRHNAEMYHQYVVLSVEKNRAGSDLVDLEFKKQLQFCHFRQDGRRVVERLITGRLAHE